MEDTARDKKRQLEVQVDNAQLNLSDYAYISQVKTLLDNRLRGLITQEVNLTETDRTDEQDGRFDQMNAGLPSSVDGVRFREAMTTFATELAARPLPERLENFDSAAGRRDAAAGPVRHPGRAGWRSCCTCGSGSATGRSAWRPCCA